MRPSTTCCSRAGGSAARATSTRADEFRDETGLESFDALLTTVAAFLHAAERRLGHGDLEAVEADHAGLEPLAEQAHSLGVVRETEGGQTVRQPVGFTHHRVEVAEWIQQGDGT